MVVDTILDIANCLPRDPFAVDERMLDVTDDRLYGDACQKLFLMVQRHGTKSGGRSAAADLDALTAADRGTAVDEEQYRQFDAGLTLQCGTRCCDVDV